VLPFALLGFDSSHDTAFMNEIVRDYCTAAAVEFTRCRPYRKNDQARFEQKKQGDAVRLGRATTGQGEVDRPRWLPIVWSMCWQ
jgi:hypothetical protein